MAERFFAAAIGPDDTVRLTDEEAHHLTRVRRIRRGERVQIFDGSGIECEAIVREIGRGEVTLSIESRRHVDRELPFSLTLGCSPAKGDRLRWLVEKATELGVTRFVPILTERSTEQARRLSAEKTRRWVIEACKQCGRNQLMHVSAVLRWKDFVETCSSANLRLVASRTGGPLHRVDLTATKSSVVIAVGPEGGFTSEELEMSAQFGWQFISLGPRILRVETAALATVAWISAALQ